MGDWIPCTERLPDNDRYVLVCTKTAKGAKNIKTGYYLANHGLGWVVGMNSNVIAWMELPKPYEEAADETGDE